MALGKPKLHTRSEDASFIRCRNIKGEPPTLQSSHFFFWVAFYDGHGQTQAAYQIWSRWLQPFHKYWTGSRTFKYWGPQNFRELLYPRATPIFSRWDFMMGLGKAQLRTKFEVAGFICCGNVREFVFENWDKPKSGNPLFFGLYHRSCRCNVSYLMYVFCGAMIKKWVILRTTPYYNGKY